MNVRLPPPQASSDRLQSASMIRDSQFKPAWWLKSAHLQTLWPTFIRWSVRLPTERERLHLPDGDFIDLDWVGDGEENVVLMLHGLEGSVESPYVKGLLREVKNLGWRGVCMNFRGCSGQPNILPKGYHAGHTYDVAYVVDLIRQRYPNAKVAAIGVSLGGNVLLKWLGETGKKNPLVAAVAVSVPFELTRAAEHVNRGMSRIYQWWLLRQMRYSLKRKFEHVESPVDFGELNSLDDFWKYDDMVTAPLHGFQNVHEYYTKNSSRYYLKNITVPTLIIHAKDDPVTSGETVASESELSTTVTLEITETGGHVGFITGRYPWKPVYWLEQRIPQYLSKAMSDE